MKDFIDRKFFVRHRRTSWGTGHIVSRIMTFVARGKI